MSASSPPPSGTPPPRPGPRRGSRVAPLYQQVYVQLRDWLVDTAPDPTIPLPSEPALARKYGVSRVTIRKTLEALEAEGMIRRIRGTGTFPVAQGEGAERTNISGFLENLLSYDAATTATNLVWHMASPPDRVAAAFGPGDCLEIVRLRRLRNLPVSFTAIHVPAALADRLDPTGDSAEPVIRALERRGVIAVRAEQAITALPAPVDAAAHLGVEPGAPLICMRRLMLTETRAPVLHQESLYAPDRFEYRMILTRTSAGQAPRWTPIG